MKNNNNKNQNRVMKERESVCVCVCVLCVGVRNGVGDLRTREVYATESERKSFCIGFFYFFSPPLISFLFLRSDLLRRLTLKKMKIIFFRR